MIRQDAFHRLAPQLASEGFKILFDILMTARGALRIVELPYTFGTRTAGSSKLDLQNVFDFLGLLVSKASRGYVPLRFVSFMFVGLIGVFVHLAALRVGLLAGAPLHRGASRGNADRHDQQLLAQQRHHLSRPQAQRCRCPERPADLLCDLQRRCAEQRRRGDVALLQRAGVVDCRPHGLGDRRGLELHDVEPGAVAALSPFAKAGGALTDAHYVLLLIAAALVGRLAFAGTLGLGIDERYTVATARTFALSTFDHPPLAWWLAGGARWLFGTEAALAVRLPFVLLFALTTWLMFAFTRQLFGSRAGLFAAVTLNLAPVLAWTTGSFVLPDGPLIAATMAGAYCLARVLYAPGSPSPLWWLAAGACGGLACLSKLHGVFLFAGTALFLLTTPIQAALDALRPGPIWASPSRP